MNHLLNKGANNEEHLLMTFADMSSLLYRKDFLLLGSSLSFSYFLAKSFKNVKISSFENFPFCLEYSSILASSQPLHLK